MIGLSKIGLAEDSSCEGVLELNLRAENTRNLWTFVQYVNLAVHGRMNGCLVNFVGKWSFCGRISGSLGYWSE